MPVYEYRCTFCRHKWEELVLKKGDEPHRCPECGSTQIKKIMSTSVPIVR